jgi:hypothetical protein
VKKAALSRLAECREGIEADVESAQLHVVESEMCPSIETAMHAILPSVLSSTCTRSTPLCGQYLWTRPANSKNGSMAYAGNGLIS